MGGSGAARARGAAAVAGGLLAGIGRTPLVELKGPATRPRGLVLLGKLESVNPGGSIKDRPVARMLTRALEDGRLGGGRRLIDSSSGNAGIAYAMLGAALGVPVTLVVPANASRERLERIASHGAELILTDPIEGYDFAVHEARRLARERSDLYWHCDQYGNDDNWRAHHDTTGVEILEQCQERLGGPPEAFVAGVGTGGTITGVGRRLRTARPDTFLGCAIPEPFPGIEGLKPLGHPGDLVPAILDEGLIDERLELRLDEAAATAQELAREGLFVGPSSGAFVLAACRFAERHGFANVVVPLCDTGERYGSTGLWNATR